MLYGLRFTLVHDDQRNLDIKCHSREDWVVDGIEVHSPSIQMEVNATYAGHALDRRGKRESIEKSKLISIYIYRYIFFKILQMDVFVLIAFFS